MQNIIRQTVDCRQSTVETKLHKRLNHQLKKYLVVLLAFYKVNQPKIKSCVLVQYEDCRDGEFNQAHGICS